MRLEPESSARGTNRTQDFVADGCRDPGKQPTKISEPGSCNKKLQFLKENLKAHEMQR